MRRSVGAAVVAVALLGAGTASAQAAVYEGHFRGQPSSSVSLTFVKQNGKRFLDQIELHYTTTCEDGPTNQSLGPGALSPRPRVHHGHFKYVAPNVEPPAVLRIAGDLKPGGKAVGTFRYYANFGPPHGICDTGNLEWVAFK